MKCKHCAEEIQDKAKVCKHCGKRVGMGISGKKFLAWTLGTIVIGVALGSLVDQDTTRTSSPVSAPIAQVDKSEEKQSARKALIQKLVNEGVFQKVEVPGSLPRVWVTPRFKALSFDEKQQFISVVYAYHFDGKNSLDSVRLYDSLTSKEIGTYGQQFGGFGLKLD